MVSWLGTRASTYSTVLSSSPADGVDAGGAGAQGCGADWWITGTCALSCLAAIPDCWNFGAACGTLLAAQEKRL